MTDSEVPDALDSMHYGFYVVAYLDVLGQREAVNELVTFRHTPDNLHRARAIISRTAMRTRIIRRFLDSHFEQLQVGAPHDFFTADQLREYPDARTIKFHRFGFSDSFAVAASLEESSGHGPLKAAVGVFVALQTLAGLFIATLAHQIPLRGGIDVERGIDVFPNEVYGPVLVNAYDLERLVAAFPRIAVGDGLREYLDHLAKQNGVGMFAGVTTELAARCTQLLVQAPDDGSWMVHMLSPQILSIEGSLDDAIRAYDWVKHEHRRFEAEGNENVALKYKRLLLYFNASGFKG